MSYYYYYYFSSSIQPQQLSLPTQTMCMSMLYPCDDLLAADGIHVFGVAQCPGGGLWDGGHVPIPADNSTPHIMTSETSLLATSLTSHVALLGVGILLTPPSCIHLLCLCILLVFLWLLAVPMVAMAYSEQYICFDPGGVDPASLDAPGVVDDYILDFLDVTMSSVGSDGPSALYGLNHILCSLELSCSASHTCLHALVPALGPAAPIYAHMGGDSPATMFPHVDLLCPHPRLHVQ